MGGGIHATGTATGAELHADPGQPQFDLTFDLSIDVLDPVLWLFIAMLATFVLTRVVTRRIRASSDRRTVAEADGAGGSSGRSLLRNISIGGVHVHHQVFGILLMLGAGVVLIAVQPDGVALNVTAAVFGMGVSLAFDEFALWLHLEDVYWTPEGRKSVDAIFVVLAITGVLISGVDVFPVLGGTWGVPLGILAVLVLAVVCLLKGKVPTGVVGVVLFPVAIVGALRLAKPDSWWARRWYTRRPRSRRRSAQRFGDRYTARWNRIRDLVAGAPHLPGRSAGGPHLPGRSAGGSRLPGRRTADARIPARPPAVTPRTGPSPGSSAGSPDPR